MAELGWSSTTDDVLDALLAPGTHHGDLSDRTVLITGASTGLGEETARALASRGAHVVMAVRDRARGEAAANRILSACGTGVRLAEVDLDLESLASVRAAAQRVIEGFGRLDALINNAGIMACPQGRTADGFERQMGTNHLAHHLLARLLTPLLASTAQASGRATRVIALSSRGHSFADVDLDDLHGDRTPYDPFTAYGRSKTANVLFAVEYDRRHATDGVRAYSVHPGGIRTELGRHMTPELVASLMSNVGGADQIRWKSIPQGAATTVWALLAPELEMHGGAYCEDCGIAQVSDDPAANSGVRPYALDPQRARVLWDLSDAATGVH
jgi:NAD(P)-dependent dehydrogenase (short-subunit alcohol dehydrogenase family)